MTTTLTGGCLCGQVRYTATGSPSITGQCYCADCRKASGSGFIPFMGFPAAALTFTGATLQYRSMSARGTEAVRNSCPACGSLVFGGVPGTDISHTIYAGRSTIRPRSCRRSRSLRPAAPTGHRFPRA